MNMVDLRRTGRKGAFCAAVGAFALLGTGQATAEVANANLIPAESAYIISVPNASTFWSAWEANGLYEAYKKVMAMPEVEAKVADFRKELSIVESSLGFKLDGDTLSKVFASVDLTMVPGDEAGIVAVMKVADKDKLAKLMDLAEKAAAQSVSADSDTSGTTAGDTGTSAIAVAEYQGVKIKTFNVGDDDKKVVYADTGDFLFVANTDALIKKTIDRSKAATPGADTVGGSADFKKIDAALSAEKGELYIYGNQQLASKMNAKNEMPASISTPLKALMDDFAPITYYGASMKIAPKEISSYSYGILKQGTSDSLLLKNPGDKPLKVATYIPETTMLTVATSLFNAESIYKLITGVADSSDAKLEDKLQSLETGLGFSVKNDLIPAIGNEVAFSLNNVEFGGLLPTVDGAIILGVKDKAKMQKVVSGVERLATNAMAAKAGDSETSAPAFQTAEVAGQTIKYMEIPGLAGLAPGYALSDDYLFIGSTKAALTGALEAASNGKSLAAGDKLKSLGHGVSASANVIQFASVSRILDVAKQLTSAIPAVASAGKYIDALQVIDVTASVSRVENGAAVGHGVVKLK